MGISLEELSNLEKWDYNSYNIITIILPNLKPVHVLSATIEFSYPSTSPW